MIGAKVDLDLSPADGLLKGGALRKCLRVGVNRAASPVKAAVVSEAERIKLRGHTAKAVRIRLRLYPADRWVAVIGPSSAFARVGRKRRVRGATPGAAVLFKPSKYAHLVEKGTRRSKARPFLKPAHDRAAGPFLQSAGAAVGREVELELLRRARR